MEKREIVVETEVVLWEKPEWHWRIYIAGALPFPLSGAVPFLSIFFF